MSDAAYEAGMEVRREVLGDAHVDRAIERTTEFTAPFQEFITRYAWGGVWTRARAGPRDPQRDHAGGADRARARERDRDARRAAALRNGLTAAEIAEVLLHTAVYAGVPAANAAFAIAQRTFDSEDG